MRYKKLTIVFTDDIDDNKVNEIYNSKFKNKGTELGEISINTTDKTKTIIITPSTVDNVGNDLNVNDFTTQLVLTYKIQTIKTEVENK